MGGHTSGGWETVVCCRKRCPPLRIETWGTQQKQILFENDNKKGKARPQVVWATMIFQPWSVFSKTSEKIPSAGPPIFLLRST